MLHKILTMDILNENLAAQNLPNIMIEKFLVVFKSTKSFEVSLEDKSPYLIRIANLILNDMVKIGELNEV